MDPLVKTVVALEDLAPQAVEDFVGWARAVARTGEASRVEVEWCDHPLQARHTTKPVRFSAFASLWTAPDASVIDAAALPHRTQWFRVREQLAFDRSARPDEARAWAGCKKTTPWAPVAGVDARTWQARYTNHGLIAQAYHATCVRYRQNVVLAGSDPGIAAVSELWWTNAEDLVERFVASPEAAELLHVDTSGFVDATRAHPTVTMHETLVVPHP